MTHKTEYECTKIQIWCCLFRACLVFVGPQNGPFFLLQRYLSLSLSLGTDSAGGTDSSPPWGALPTPAAATRRRARSRPSRRATGSSPTMDRSSTRPRSVALSLPLPFLALNPRDDGLRLVPFLGCSAPHLLARVCFRNRLRF
jgi:hypothetical protein